MRRLALALLWITGCSSEQSYPDAGADSGFAVGVLDSGPGAFDAGPQAPVFWRLIHHVSGLGTEDELIDLIDAGVQVISPVQSDFQVHQVVACGDGGFTIANPPAGPIYIGLGSTYVVTREPRIDLSVHDLGRRGLVVSDGGTSLSLSLSGLDPWTSSDQLELLSGGAGIRATLPLPLGQGVTAATVPLSVSALIDSSQGDVVYAGQLACRPLALDGGTFSSCPLVKAGILPATTLIDHSQNQVAVALTGPPQGSAVIDWPRGDWGVLTSLVAPNASQSTQYLYIGPVPYTADFGAYASPPELTTLMAQPPAPQAVTGTLSFGNPYPATWPLVLQVYQYFSVTLHGNTSYVTCGYSDLLTRLEGVPLRPLLSPPAGLKVNNLDGTVPHTVVGPVQVSWGPPAIGTATGYSVEVLQVVPPNSGTLVWVGRVVTSETSVTIPGAFMGIGNVYVFQVRSMNFGGVSFSRTPFETAFPALWAIAFSGAVTLQ